MRFRLSFGSQSKISARTALSDIASIVFVGESQGLFTAMTVSPEDERIDQYIMVEAGTQEKVAAVLDAMTQALKKRHGIDAILFIQNNPGEAYMTAKKRQKGKVQAPQASSAAA